MKSTYRDFPFCVTCYCIPVIQFCFQLNYQFIQQIFMSLLRANTVSSMGYIRKQNLPKIKILTPLSNEGRPIVEFQGCIFVPHPNKTQRPDRNFKISLWFIFVYRLVEVEVEIDQFRCTHIHTFIYAYMTDFINLCIYSLKTLVIS